MPDATLHGNGDDCPACALQREEDPWRREKYRCNRCNGTGRLPRSAAQIVAAEVAWARAHYWPERDRGAPA